MLNRKKALSLILSVLLTVTLLLTLNPITAFAMQVKLNVIGSADLNMDVEPTDRIEDVKAKIFDMTGYDTSDQILIFSNKILEDGNTLQDYSISNGATITLLIAANPTSVAPPMININPETNEWEISYDKGESWASLGVKATGEKGDKGDTGEKGDKGEKGATAEQGERADDLIVTISIAISGLSILLNAILIICILSKKSKNT